MAPATDDGAAAPGANAKPSRGFIDTAAPFESVKAAVSMFGGIIDWKSHKAQTEERQKQVEADLDKTQEEIECTKSLSEAAEEEKAQVLKELDSTRKLVEELKLNLEKAETDETEAKQDSELALLRVREVQQGIDGKASVAAQTELDVARSRHAYAVSELESVKKELEDSREEYSTLLKEKEMAIKNAAEAVFKSRDAEKKVDDLSLDVITTKEALESARADHMEAEEHRINVALLKGEDAPQWEKEFRRVNDEIRQLSERIVTMKALRTKVDEASASLLELKREFSTYMEGKSNELGNTEGDEHKDSATHVRSKAEKDLEEINLNIVKAKEEVNCLRAAVASLKAELAGEEAIVASMKEKEEERPVEEVSSLESELGRIEMEIELLQAKEKETRRKLEELPALLQQATLEAEEAKLAVKLANEELLKAREEAERAKVAVSEAESKLKAALREIDAAKASEKIALDAVKALEESDKAASSGDVENKAQSGVTLPLDEYYELSKKTHDAEQQANNKVADAILLVEEAKKAEARSLERLVEVTGRLEERKESLHVATEKADSANIGKLAVEQELREWRAVSEQHRKLSGNFNTKDVFNPSPEGCPRKSTIGRRDTRSMDIQHELPAAIRRSHSSKTDTSTSNDGHIGEQKKKKKTFFPRIVMFFARKKAHSTK